MKLLKNISLIILTFLAVSLLAHMPGLLRNGGLFILNSDMNSQLIPFYLEGWDQFHNGVLFTTHWNWNDWLGNNYPGTAIYYYLFNPYFIISLLFSACDVYVVVTYLNVLKFVVGGTLFYLYLRKLGFASQVALIGGMLYIFSGPFTVNYSYFFFNDFLSLFPIVLFGIERLIHDSKIDVLVIGLFLCGVTSYYFSYFLIWFCVIYLLVRLYLRNDSILSEPENTMSRQKHGILYNPTSRVALRKIFLFCVSGCIAISLAMVAVLPAFFHLINNSRVGRMQKEILYKPITWIVNMASIFYGFLLPPENVMHGAIFRHSHEYLQSMTYFTSFLFLAMLPQVYSLLKDRPRIKKLLWFSLGFFVLINSSPLLLSAVSHMSSITFRWSFLTTSMSIVFFCYMIHDLNRINYKNLLIGFAVVAVFSFLGIGLRFFTFVYANYFPILYRLRNNLPHESFVEYSLISIVVPLAVLFIIIVFLYFRKSINHKTVYTLILLFISFEGIIQFNQFFRITHLESEVTYFRSIREDIQILAEAKSEDESLSRYSIGYLSGYGDYIDSNISFLTGIKTLSTYNSLYNTNVNGFYKLLYGDLDDWFYYDFWRKEVGITKYNLPLLSTKYYLGRSEHSLPSSFSLVSEVGDFALFENDSFVELGFQYKAFMTIEEFNRLPWFARDYALLNAVIIDDSWYSKLYESGLRSVSSSEIMENLVSETLEINTVPTTITFDEDGELYYPVKQGLWLSHDGVSLYRNNPSNYFPTYLSTVFFEGESVYIDHGDGVIASELVFMPSDKNDSVSEILENRYKPTEVVLGTNALNFYYDHHDAGISLLFTSIPYSPDWTVFVDGAKTETVELNQGFLGIFITAEQPVFVEAIYNAKGYNFGKWWSLATLLILGAVLINRYSRQFRK